MKIFLIIIIIWEHCKKIRELFFKKIESEFKFFRNQKIHKNNLENPPKFKFSLKSLDVVEDELSGTALAIQRTNRGLYNVQVIFTNIHPACC